MEDICFRKSYKFHFVFWNTFTSYLIRTHKSFRKSSFFITKNQYYFLRIHACKSRRLFIYMSFALRQVNYEGSRLINCTNTLIINSCLSKYFDYYDVKRNLCSYWSVITSIFDGNRHRFVILQKWMLRFRIEYES